MTTSVARRILMHIYFTPRCYKFSPETRADLRGRRSRLWTMMLAQYAVSDANIQNGSARDALTVAPSAHHY
jgi:hypothetical protein